MAADTLSTLDTGLMRHRDTLAEEFAGIFSAETIARYLSESINLLPSARKVETFVPLLVYRFTRERLNATAHNEGAMTTTVPEVLFVCVQNAGRSQMAAGLLKLEAGERVHIRSAGSTPAEQIHPSVVEVMAEIGVDIGEEFPKPMTDEVVSAADVVITMGCGDACPVYPGKLYRDWEVEDPAGQTLADVRRLRDDIHGRVRALVAELLPA